VRLKNLKLLITEHSNQKEKVYSVQEFLGLPKITNVYAVSTKE